MKAIEKSKMKLFAMAVLVIISVYSIGYAIGKICAHIF